MELEFDRARWTQDGAGFWLCWRVKIPQAARRFADGMKQVVYTALLVEKHKKRSRDANAYLWVLCGKIGDKLRKSKDEVYLDMLKHYGQGGVVKIPNQFIDDFQRAYKYHEKHESLPDEDRAQYFRFWVGSSNYDTEEMSILIDGVIQEAKDLDIETATPEEIAIMKSRWGNAQADKSA